MPAILSPEEIEKIITTYRDFTRRGFSISDAKIETAKAVNRSVQCVRRTLRTYMGDYQRYRHPHETPEYWLKLLEFCKTPKERSLIETRATTETAKEAGASLGINKTDAAEIVRRIKARAALQGFAPEYDLTKPIPETHLLKGVSTYYNKDGQVAGQWVKSDVRREQIVEFARMTAEAIAADVPRFPVSVAPLNYDQDLCVVIPFGDPHIGLYTWAEETGAEFNLEIATRHLCAAVERLVEATPNAAECLIANLGDFFHADNLQGVTSRSGHHLDTSGRWLESFRAGLRAMSRCIEAALSKFQKVTVINAIGNHDDQSSLVLSVCLANQFANDDRVTIVQKPTVTHFHQFGQNLFGVHHGNSIKPNELPQVMAASVPELWGNTKHRYWFCGHIHHDTKKEYPGVMVETFRTLAARDAYAASRGYQSGRDMKALVFHREFGEIGRHLISVAMIDAKQNDLPK